MAVNFLDNVSVDGDVIIGPVASSAGLLHVSAGTSGDAIVVIHADTDNSDENDVPQIWFKADGDVTEALIGLNNNYLDFVSNVNGLNGFRYFTGTTNNTGTTDPYTNATEKMRLTNTGDLGIGTTSPGAKLDVNGSIRANSSGTDGGIEIGVWDQTSAYNFIGTSGMSGLEYSMIFDGTNTFVGAGTGGALKLRGPANDSSPSIVIDGSSVTVDDGASAGQGAIRAKYKSSDNSAGLTSTIAVRNGNNSASLTFTIKDGIITGISSDRRLKTNITLIGTSDSGINIYTFEYKYKFSKAGLGLFQGVMSDEVPAEAVSVDTHGFDVVDYSLIDVEFRRVSI